MTRANTKDKAPSWQLQEAKSGLSQVVDHALSEGPQTITLHGKPSVVVVSFEEFQNLTRPPTSPCEFFRQKSLIPGKVNRIYNEKAGIVYEILPPRKVSSHQKNKEAANMRGRRG
jgi:prevent-host-death family protein